MDGIEDMDLKDVYNKIEALDADDAEKSQLKEQAYIYNQAMQAFGENRYDDVVNILEMLHERVPDDINAKAMLAVAYGTSGKPVKSIRLLEEICEEEPDDGDYSLALAMAYRQHDWVQKALSQLKTTVELIPDNRLAWENLVECSVETEDTHEAKMNCFGAIYLLKEYGIESIRLSVAAFSFMILEDNDKADKYLTTIIDIMRDSEEQQEKYYENAINDIIWEVDISECYEFLPRIKEMVEYLPEISEKLAVKIMKVEIDAEIAIVDETFPEMLCSMIRTLNSGCDCIECERSIISVECSILADHNGYNPELVRLSKEHPKLYAMHSKFFDEAVSGVDRERLLNARFRLMAEDDLEPILVRADGSEINPVVETYRREGRKIGRNEMCPCGSGKKYKKCCGA